MNFIKSSCLFLVTITCFALVMGNPTSEYCVCLTNTQQLVTCSCSGDNVTDVDTLFTSKFCNHNHTVQLILTKLPKLTIMSTTVGGRSLEECNGWKNVLSLKITETGLKNISASSFQSLRSIKILDISQNPSLISYHRNVFSPIGDHLIELTATNNRVHSLGFQVFAGLKKLKKLLLSNNNIGYIAPEVFTNDCCSQIVELRLDHNILTDLDAGVFKGLTSLKLLDLRSNPLQKLSPELTKPFWRTLTHFWMSHNDTINFGGFGYLPKGLISHLSELRVLHIDELKLRNLSADSFVGLYNLEELSLKGNRLTKIPNDCFSQLPQLVKLDLSSNALVCLPDISSEHYPKLRWLDLSWNGLTHLISNNFAGLAQSEPTAAYPKFILNISSNPIQRIEFDTFCRLGGPVDLIVSDESHDDDLPVINTDTWHDAVYWPDNPLALVGNNSSVRGLKSSSQALASQNPILLGRDDAKHLCSLSAEALMSAALAWVSKAGNFGGHSREEINASLESDCSWLPPSQLHKWQLAKLGVPGSLTDRDMVNSIEQGSRIYLLVIVAVCITFLLVAFSVIVCYRAWSRRLIQKLELTQEPEVNGLMGGHIERRLSDEIINSDKLQLLERSLKPYGKEVQQRTLEGLPETQEGRTANGTTKKPDAEGCPSPDASNAEDSLEWQKEETSEKMLPTTASGTWNSRQPRPLSEPKAEELGNVTAFGII